MSFSAPQSKVASPVRTPRTSMSGERPAHPANKPAGIINMGMTCFLNSTFQSLAATPALIALLSHNPALPLHPVPDSPLPAPVQSNDATPCLRADSLEPPLYALLPVSRQFTNALHRAWTMKDNGGGTAGPGESSSRHSLTLRSLLKELARKYDQYDEFAQQDAHELLRHLLDSMQMEEKDVIKRIRQDRGGASAPATPAAVDTPGTPTTPGSAVSVPLAMSASAPLERAGALSLTAAASGTADLKLIPFVDALFGGLLASVVVCETCKSVSHTYEGFLDISVGMRGDTDAQPQRKRDRFRAMASRLKPKHKLDKEHHATMSEPEGSDSEHGRRRHHGHGHGLGLGQPPPMPPPPSLSPSATSSGSAAPAATPSDAESDGAGLSRSGSKLGGRVRPSFSFRRKEKGSRASSGGSKTSPASSPGVETPAKLEYAPVPSTDSGPPTPRPSSPNPEHHPPNPHHHTASPTPAQAAYIQRILYGPPGPPEANDPLAKLKAAHAGISVGPKDYGLIDALKNFTAVEVLEGDNAFACHKCWKIKTGRYARRQERERQAQLSKAGANGNAELPFIAVENADASNSELASPRAGRLQPRSPGLVRAPSPLRQMVERRPSHDDVGAGSGVQGISEEDNAPTPTPPMSSLTSVTSASALSVDSAVSAGTTGTTATTGTSSSSSSPFPRADDDSDGLSDSSSDSDDNDDEPPPDLSSSNRRGFFGQNIQRTTSRPAKHFVLRKAFKRYLIAKAPEVLVFHIKRFKQTTSSVYSTFSSLKKLDDFVSFPETLDLGPFMAPNRNDFKVVPTPQGPRAPYQDWPSPEQCPEAKPMPYRLYAVVVHLGTMVGGHYIAYVLVDPERMFAAPNDPGMAEYFDRLKLEDADDATAGAHKKDRRVWCYCSDTEIRLASVDEVLAARAYLCFYEKV